MRAAKMKERPSFQLMVQTDVQSIYHMQMPRWLFSDPRYCEMSLEAKVTYTFLLNRFQLSRRNGWVNERGEVFVIFPRKALAKELRICEQRVTAAFKKLVELELVWEKRCGRGDANQIYLAYVTPQDDPTYTSAPFEDPEEGCVSRTVDSAPLEEEEMPSVTQEPQDLQVQNSGMRAPRTAETALLEPRKLPSSKKEKRNTNGSYTKISQSIPATAGDGLTDEEREAEFLAQSRVRARLRRLDGMILREVEHKLRENREENVTNSTAYIMAVLFNCIAESESDLMIDPYLNSLSRPA